MQFINSVGLINEIGQLAEPAVSTGMGGWSRSGIPLRYVTIHPGQLSLAITPWVGAMVSATAGGAREETASSA